MKPKPLTGEVRLPGDKSISHRALILAAMAEGPTVIENLSDGEDVRSTWRCLQALGVKITSAAGGRVHVAGAGWRGLSEPRAELDCGNSGTTMRLLMGLLAGQDLAARLSGDESLRRRPMERVAAPLRLMGAAIETSGGGTAPVSVRGGALAGVDCVLPVASAQVKSAVLLAGLLATGKTSVTEPAASRDHTERMLPLFGVMPEREERKVTVPGGLRLAGARLEVPGDPSAAAFWAVAALITPGSRLVLRNVGLNPTRLGFVRVLRRMGALLELREIGAVGAEPVGDIVAEHSTLRAVETTSDEAPLIIDEAPILAVAASQARGETRLRWLAELRHKESDRLASTQRLVESLGGRCRAQGDDLIVEGPTPLRGGAVRAESDHRIAMAAMIAGLACESPVEVDDAACAAISYPGFFRQLEALRG